MNLSPSTRLLIHILAVLCLSFRLVLSDDGDLLSVVAFDAADGDGSNAKSTADPTTMEPSTTDDSTTESDLNTTESILSTTESDSNTTEGIVSTSSTAAILLCVPSNKVDSPSVCVLEGTEELCDPCDAIDCGADKYCEANNSTCKASDVKCECSDQLTFDKEGVCTNPCLPSPCKNDQPCTPLPKDKTFHCDCSPDYEGTLCEKDHDRCKDPDSAGCPTGPGATCDRLGFGNYSCGCSPGYILDNVTDTCFQVTERLNVTLKFTTLYMEAYNVEDDPNRVMAINSIDAAMEDLYGDLLIKPISYFRFTEGSLIAHYSMNMRMAKNGDPEKNVDDLKVYVTDCSTKTPKGICFGEDLGKPFLPENGVSFEDLRCADDFCPVGTHCEPVVKSDTSTRCSCDDGYTLDHTVVDDRGKSIDICIDINECELDPPPCEDNELCINTPGSFECLGNPCDKNPCPGNAQCKAVDHYAYDCQCDWIYVASDCGTPWMLILVIVSSVLLALLILAIIGLIILCSQRAKAKGSSVIASTSF